MFQCSRTSKQSLQSDSGGEELEKSAENSSFSAFRQRVGRWIPAAGERSEHFARSAQAGLRHT
jgi:hypothetical protein